MKSLLYFIFFWEFYHDKIPKELQEGDDPLRFGRMSLELLDKPIEDICRRYVEIVGLATYRVFDDDVVFASLDIGQMRNVLINNLYKSYNAPKRFSVVFDVLNAGGDNTSSYITDNVISIGGSSTDKSILSSVGSFFAIYDTNADISFLSGESMSKLYGDNNNDGDKLVTELTVGCNPTLVGCTVVYIKGFPVVVVKLATIKASIVILY